MSIRTHKDISGSVYSASLGFQVTVIGVKGTLFRECQQSYVYDHGQWSCTSIGSYDLSLFKFGLSIPEGPVLLLSASAGTINQENGWVVGDWVAGGTADVNFKGPSATADIGVRDYTIRLNAGTQASSARASIGFNMLGLNLSFFAEAFLGARVGLQVGKESALYAGVGAFGVDIGSAKTAESRPGWANLAEDAWNYFIAPIARSGSAAGITHAPSW